MAISEAPAVSSSRPGRVWFTIGVTLLAYAVLGNYFVLPGYRRFLEHGRPDAGQAGVDVALIWGAAKTILWMIAFHLGAFCLAIAALIARGDAIRMFRRWFTLAALAWLVLWGVPSLPGPYAAFFASAGVVILVMIVAVFGWATLNAAREQVYFDDGRAGHWHIASIFFFALATWDMCGLGSVGGILHPDAGIRAASQTLVVTQTTKLILEMMFAWGLLAMAARPRAQGRGDA